MSACHHTTPIQDRSGVLPAAGGRPGKQPGTSYDTPHVLAGKTSALLGQPIWARAVSLVCNGSAAAGPRAPFHNNNKRKE